MLTIWLCPRRRFLIGTPAAAETTRDPYLSQYRLRIDRRNRVRLPPALWHKLDRPAAITFAGAIRHCQIWPTVGYARRSEHLEGDPAQEPATAVFRVNGSER